MELPVRVRTMNRRYHYICPKCGRPIEFKKRVTNHLCLRCGQKLDWDGTEKQISEIVTASDSSEALCIAERYFATNQMAEKDWFDLEDWRKSLRGRTELFLIFKNEKAHGEFMRWAGKERITVK